jgi:hypothetical protein
MNGGSLPWYVRGISSLGLEMESPAPSMIETAELSGSADREDWMLVASEERWHLIEVLQLKR